jgi:hypothetical protein
LLILPWIVNKGSKLGGGYLDESVLVEEVFGGDFESDSTGACFWIEACLSSGLDVRKEGI